MKGTPRNTLATRLPFTQATCADETFSRPKPCSIERTTKNKEPSTMDSPWLTCRNSNRLKKGPLLI